jgi:hypothetical protein
MDKEKLIDMALEAISSDMDDLEGKSALEHSLEECPDPLTCDMHKGELSDNLSKDEKPDGIEVEVHKIGMPSLEGEKFGKAEDGLSPEEADELKKLIK